MTAAGDRRGRAVAVVALVLSLAGCGSARRPADGPEPPAEGAGAALFDRGLRANGEAVRATGPDGSPLPAAAVACANCHGSDGRGRPEGGIVPTDITWDNLGRPTGGTQSTGRRFPAYTDALFVRAVTLGLDSAGRPLAPTMPRYQLTREEAADLTAHLHRLGSRAEPGVLPGEVRIGLLTPADRPGGSAVRRATEAYLDRTNAAGGVNGRQLRLVAADLPAEGENGLPAGEPVFAVLGGLVDGRAEVLRCGAADGRPVVGLLGPPPADVRSAYSLFAGPDVLCRTLAVHAVNRPVTHRALVGGAGPAATAVREEWKKAGVTWNEADLAADGSDADVVATRLRDAGVELCLVAAPPAAAGAFARAADRLGWRPELLGPAASLRAVADGPAAATRWVLAFPTLQVDYAPAALAEFEQLATASRLPADHRSLQLAAVAAAKVLVEALRRAGRDLTRERLTAVLEDGTAFPTGLTPPLRFGPGRRVGARGAYLARPNPAGGFDPIGGWQELP